ncbi:DUF4865 family protein [Saccharothrix syringae]|uniref:DUF4865 family protein n=1 Tax=Saccharothrix syringae TaxID=103733 RepID=A0A5Q0H673_SACSY|nr:DUF4865 family protein [Saccharothrix syringae]QFZ21748.1 DUF4865 family protein [Saccharothrix syringae]
MHLMQYEITLPADYDMAVIHRRVATRGSATDDFPGLGFKAYCARERGVDGSPVNQYAPFYAWRAVEGMNAFLWGPYFRGLSNDFGRPVVRHWVGAGFERGPAGTATAATRRVERVPADADAGEVVERALAELRDHARDPGVHATALAVDPSRWELVRFTLWRDETPDEEVRYRVLHLSRPEADDLSPGRHW